MITIPQQIANTFADKSITIVWFGIEWHSTLAFLLECGISPQQITIRDWWIITDTSQSVTYIQGTTYLEGVWEHDVIIRSAWVSPHLPWLMPYQEKITSQLQLFFEHFPNKSIVVTWTKWKSTTVSLLSAMFMDAGISYELVGNIWVPVLSLLLHEVFPEWAIIECSSYQLDWLKASPTIGILTNLYHEHHATWHWWETPYFMSKIRAIESCQHMLVSSQVADEHSILAWDLLNEHRDTMHTFWAWWTYTFRKGNFMKQNTSITTDTDMKLKWKHNRYNACAVLWVADILQIPTIHFENAIRSFAPLEHRLEDCGIHWWIHRVNDAISTTPQSTIAALHTLWTDVETLFLWGKDGQYDFGALISLIEKSSIQTLIFFPDSGLQIQKQLTKSYTTLVTRSMQEAVLFAAKNTKPWKIALLSCASPSYGLWKNFEEKWTLFKDSLKTLWM